MKFITIIPAYNEEQAIQQVVKKSSEYSKVLVVDDGSEDQTFQLAVQAGAKVIKHDQNRGKGAALKSGLIFALNEGYDIMVFIDGDCQHDPAQIPSLVTHINGSDLVIGSRFLTGAPANMPFHRRMSNKFTTFIMRHLTGYHLSDSQSGFRALSRQAAEIFKDIPYDDYVYESEMLYKAYKNNLKVEEVAIPCHYGIEKSYVTSRHALNYFFFVCKRISRKTKRRVYS